MLAWEKRQQVPKTAIASRSGVRVRINSSGVTTLSSFHGWTRSKRVILTNGNTLSAMGSLPTNRNTLTAMGSLPKNCNTLSAVSSLPTNCNTLSAMGSLPNVEMLKLLLDAAAESDIAGSPPIPQ